jgi:hypothetical protein
VRTWWNECTFKWFMLKRYELPELSVWIRTPSHSPKRVQVQEDISAEQMLARILTEFALEGEHQLETKVHGQPQEFKIASGWEYTAVPERQDRSPATNSATPAALEYIMSATPEITPIQSQAPAALAYITSDTPEDFSDFLSGSTQDVPPAEVLVPDARTPSDTSTQQEAAAREQTTRVQQFIDGPPAPRRDFITDSTPEISTQDPPSATSPGASQNSVDDSPYLVTRVAYEERVCPVGYDPQWDETELHQCARRVMGVQNDQQATLQMVDQCAQSDAEPNWLLTKVEPQTTEELLDWISAPVKSTQLGADAVARMRETIAEQDKARRQQEVAQAAQVRARIRQRQHVFYGTGIDKSYSWNTLNIGFDNRPRQRLEVRTDIPEEILMAAIAEQYEVGGEMEFVVDGLAGAKWYDICEYATYTLYRVETILRLQPQRILGTRFIKAQGHVPVPIVMRYGMREERVAVRQDMTRSEMVSQMIAQFRVGSGEWTVGIEDAVRNAQAEFKISPDWRYTLEQLRRPTAHVMMRHRGQSRERDVPEGTSEADMKRLLVSGFGVDHRQRWRVMTRTPIGRDEPYELKRNWTYELAPYVTPATPESFRILVNTRLNGLKDDIELETSWSEGQVDEACRHHWIDEQRSGEDGSVPFTKLVTLNDDARVEPFAVHENWTYELKIKPTVPQWVNDQKLGTSPPPLHPEELVMVGLQLEGSTRIERKVKSGLTEHGLKLIMWELLDYPRGPPYLHIKNSRDETELIFKIGHQWTYTLRRQPMNMLRDPKKQRSVDGEDGDMTSATRKMHEAHSIGKPGGDGRSGTTPQGQTTPGANRATGHITVWSETKTTNLTASENTTKGELIDRIVEHLGEPKGSSAMEVRNRKGALQTKYKVVEGWSYKIYRMSPPGTQEAGNQELRKRGNETRPVLNRSSVTAWQEVAEEEQNRTEARTATSGSSRASRTTAGSLSRFAG